MVHPRRRAGPARGFTLIEMMVALAIGAILLAVALPAYQDSVRKGRRADAVAALSAVQQAQERYRANVAAYAGAVSDLQGVSSASADGHYTIAISNAGIATYTVTATANSGSAQYNDLACRQLVLQMTGGNIAYRSANSAGQVDSNNANRCWAR